MDEALTIKLSHQLGQQQHHNHQQTIQSSIKMKTIFIIFYYKNLIILFLTQTNKQKKGFKRQSNIYQKNELCLL